MTQTEKINKDYREGKISPWEHYVRVKEDAAKRQSDDATEPRSRPQNGGRLNSVLERFKRGKIPILA